MGSRLIMEFVGIGNLLRRRLQEREMAEASDGTTAMQKWFIGYILLHSRSGDVFQRDLEEAFKLRRSTASGILQKLEEAGYLTREPVDFDGRLKKIVLNQAALRRYGLLGENVERVEQVLSAGLSAEEIETLIALLDKVRKNLEG